MKNYLRLLLILGAILTMSCQQQESLSYLDSSLSPEKRTELLMAQMTLEEKIAQLNLDYDVPEADLSKEITSDQISDIVIIPTDKAELKRRWIEDVKAGKMGTTRNIDNYEKANQFQKYAEESPHKIPLFIVQNCVHGVGFDGYTTFPTYISMASSFNPELVRRSAAVTAREARLIGCNWTFAPTVDVSRDSRWGRTGETWGEDPYLASQMGVAMVKGLQYDNDPEHRIVACLKHYAAGGQSQNGLNFSAVDISERTLRDIHLRPFKAAIDAGARTIMAGHNDVQGIPCHANKFLLWDILRDEFNFDGFVITDWLDMERLVTLHKVAESWEDAVEISVNAGIDIHNHGKNYCETLYELVKEGKVSQERIDRAVYSVLKTKFEFGLFENRYVDAEDREGLICREEDRELALELARQSIVLLKNEGNVLPLKKSNNLLVAGTNLDNFSILGDWVFDKEFTNVIKIKDGFKMECPEGMSVDYFTCNHKKYVVAERDIVACVNKAKKSDVVVLVIGGSHFRTDSSIKTGGENTDVQDIELFGNQLELLKRVKATGAKVVTVLIGGRNLALEQAEKYSDAIIQAWEPGMMGGKALAQIVYGEYSPSGKLPMSVPRTTGQVNVWYSNTPSLYFRHFKFGEMGPLYEFGYGLSYTTFEYSNLQYLPKINAGERQVVSIDVTNTGDMQADEVVFCYINDKVSSVVTPVKKLVGFERVSLAPSETKSVTFEIDPDEMALYNVDMKRVVEPGEFDLFVGDKKVKYNVK